MPTSKWMMHIELKPCPFCGGKAEMVVQQLADGAPTHYGICCDSCYQGTWRWHKTEAEAAAMWNKRVEACTTQPS